MDEKREKALRSEITVLIREKKAAEATDVWLTLFCEGGKVSRLPRVKGPSKYSLPTPLSEKAWKKGARRMIEAVEKGKQPLFALPFLNEMSRGTTEEAKRFGTEGRALLSLTTCNPRGDLTKWRVRLARLLARETGAETEEILTTAASKILAEGSEKFAKLAGVLGLAKELLSAEKAEEIEKRARNTLTNTKEAGGWLTAARAAGAARGGEDAFRLLVEEGVRRFENFMGLSIKGETLTDALLAGDKVARAEEMLLRGGRATWSSRGDGGAFRKLMSSKADEETKKRLFRLLSKDARSWGREQGMDDSTADSFARGVLMRAAGSSAERKARAEAWIMEEEVRASPGERRAKTRI